MILYVRLRVESAAGLETSPCGLKSCIWHRSPKNARACPPKHRAANKFNMPNARLCHFPNSFAKKAFLLFSRFAATLTPLRFASRPVAQRVRRKLVSTHRRAPTKSLRRGARRCARSGPRARLILQDLEKFLGVPLELEVLSVQLESRLQESRDVVRFDVCEQHVTLGQNQQCCTSVLGDAHVVWMRCHCEKNRVDSTHVRNDAPIQIHALGEISQQTASIFLHFCG
mmetsp:Transcript_13458/g.36159  ORF Transcript_13458/g.36159 Transcript_13458/m.36159 type:complete len:227 (+) Transcript_13458:2266-2946(+)